MMQVLSWILPPLLLLQGALASELSYGKYINTPCTAASDCGLDTHLKCINSFCQCDSLTQIYDGSTGKCLLLLGQECQAWSGATSDKHQQSPPIKCVPHADCTKSVCLCRTGYRSTEEFLCKPDHGTACGAHDDCDHTLGLVCGSQGTCQCFNETWIYQGQFGCVDPNNPQYNEMLRLLNQTEQLLKENNLELKDVFNDLGLQNNPYGSEYVLSNMIATARQFQDTYNTNDLQFAAQNQNSQQAGGGFNLQNLLNMFQLFQNLFPRNNGGGGIGGGFFRNLFGGGGNNQAGYPESPTPAPAGGYGAPGQPEGMGQRMGLLNSFLNLFNQMIPIVRQLRMRFSPIRFFQNLVSRFAPTTAAPPQAAAIHNAPPTIISSNGNYQNNPIFDNNPGEEQSQGNAQGQGSYRFFMRTRQRFRNFLRGNRPGGGGAGGYDYTPANPPDKYGPPSGAYGPPSQGYGPPAEAPPAADAGAPPPAEPSGTSQQNFFTNNPRAGLQSQNGGQAQYSTVHVTNGGVNQQHEQFQQAAPAPAQRLQSLGNGALPAPNNFNSGHHPNPQSFFNGQSNNNQHNTHAHQQQQQQSPQYNNINAHHPSSFNAQGINNHQSQSQNNQVAPHNPPNNHQNQIFDSSRNSFVRPAAPIAPAASSPAIPQFKLPVPKVPESIAQNYILSEADDPHPGFTPHSTPAPHHHQQQDSFRTSARFERIGQVDQNQHQPSTAEENWRDSF